MSRRDAAGYVLIEDQRANIGNCGFGSWGADHGHLGQSHAEHVCDELAKVGIVEPRDGAT